MSTSLAAGSFKIVKYGAPLGRLVRNCLVKNVGVAVRASKVDTSNGENLLLIRDRRVATSYVVEALRLFDHYHFIVAQMDAKKAHKKLQLRKPPRKACEKAWWAEDYTNKRKMLDRALFA